MGATTSTRPTPARAQLSIGVPGLNDVIGGGLEPHRLYLVEGTPGAGKTTIALQFLLEGARQGESVLYVTLSETETELRGVAASHGWDLSGLHMREMLPTQDSLQPDEQYTMFHPSEVELSETTLRILSDVEASSRRASCSIRCRSCGCCRAARCDIAGRSWRSSSSSRAGNAPCCCWTT